MAGIEPDAHACEGACEVLGAGVVRHGTLQQVVPAPGSADVVATLDVLEHVVPDEHAAFARLMATVLAPGGHLGDQGAEHRGSLLSVVGHAGPSGSAVSAPRSCAGCGRLTTNFLMRCISTESRWSAGCAGMGFTCRLQVPPGGADPHDYRPPDARW